MNKNAATFLSKTLGADFLESVGNSLSKSEVYKQGTRTVTDTNDLFQGLQIVPRALLSLLVRELSPMQIGDTKEIKIPGVEETIVVVTKHERDSYSGQVIQNNVKINDFLHRSVPGLGLVLMTMLELYDIDSLNQSSGIDNNQQTEINRIIDERLNLHSLVNKVVDGKMMQRDAVQQLLMTRLNEELAKEKDKKEKIAQLRQLSEESAPQSEEYFRGMTNGLEVANCVVNEKEPEFVEPPKVIELKPKKKLALADFVESRKKKNESKGHFFQMEKSETVSCPDCGNTIFAEGAYSGCICFGENNKKIHIKKSEGGYSVKFGRGWDVENIEMLLEILRGQK